MADLEDQVWSAVGARVKDPEVNVDLKSLGWLSRKLAISEDQTVQVLLKLPTLLHPSLEDLKNLVKVEAGVQSSGGLPRKVSIQKQK